MSMKIADDKFRSLEEIYEWAVLNAAAECVSCGKPVTKMCVDIHKGGIELEGLDFKVWVWFECSCGYQSALWKIVQRHEL